jgi:hypothetical protein
MGAERVRPSAPNRPVRRTASIDIAAEAAHERAETLEKAVRRHEYAVEMAANNGRRGHCQLEPEGRGTRA